MKKDGFYKIYNPQFKPISDSLYTNVYYRNPSYDLKMKINQKFILVEKYENNYSNNNNYYSKIRGYIDYTGKVVIPIEFEKIDMITDVYGKPVGKGYINAYNKKLKKSIIYDLDGNIKVPFKYSRFGYYKNGFIEAVEYEMFDDEMRGVVGLIDTLGNQILPPKFDNIVEIKSSRIIVERNGKYGLYDMNNNEIISKKYDNIKFLDDSLVIVSYIRKFGVFDIKGNQLTEIKYTEIKKSTQPNTIEAYIDKKLFYISIKKN